MKLTKSEMASSEGSEAMSEERRSLNGFSKESVKCGKEKKREREGVKSR